MYDSTEKIWSLTPGELEALIAFASHDSARVNLWGVAFGRTEALAYVWATDGHRLLYQCRDLEIGADAVDTASPMEAKIVNLAAMKVALAAAKAASEPHCEINVSFGGDGDYEILAGAMRAEGETSASPPPHDHILKMMDTEKWEPGKFGFFNAALVKDLPPTPHSVSATRAWAMMFSKDPLGPIRLDAEPHSGATRYTVLVMPMRGALPSHSPAVKWWEEGA